jgi:hypothetical protein
MVKPRFQQLKIETNIYHYHFSEKKYNFILKRLFFADCDVPVLLVGARPAVVVEGVGGCDGDVRGVWDVVRRRVGGAAVLVGGRVVALVRVLARRLQRALRRVHLVGGGAELRRRRVGVLPHWVVQVARVVAVLRVAGCAKNAKVTLKNLQP